jgi:hypothetical protein
VTSAEYAPQLLKENKGASLTVKEISYLKAINASSNISVEDKVKLEKDLYEQIIEIKKFKIN